MANGDTLALRNKELADRVDSYQDEMGYEHRSDALDDLIRKGLRESRSPILSRWRDQVVDWAGLLVMTGAIFLAAGFVFPQIHPMTGGLMALVLAFMALAMLGIVETARLLRGSNELGARMREVVAR